MYAPYTHTPNFLVSKKQYDDDDDDDINEHIVPSVVHLGCFPFKIVFTCRALFVFDLFHVYFKYSAAIMKAGNQLNGKCTFTYGINNKTLL